MICRGVGTVLMFLHLSLAALGDQVLRDINGASASCNLEGSLGIGSLNSLLTYDEPFRLLGLIVPAAIPLVLVRRRPRSVVSAGGTP